MTPPRPLLVVARKLERLTERVLFVGGMIRGLLSTDPAAGPSRPTDDVDLIVDVDSLAAYHRLGAELRQLGCREDTREGAPLCRWIVDEVTTDVMPIDPGVLGFSNVWYESAQRHAITASTDDGVLRHIDPPHFCATKLEAFLSRGGSNYYHHDIEDVVTLVDERVELVGEIGVAPEAVREFLATTVAALLAIPQFVEALRGHLSGDETGDHRLPVLLARLQRIAALSSGREDGSTSPTIGLHVQGASEHAAAGRVHVRSSNLSWLDYDGELRALTIGFNHGGEYLYSGVPAAVYRGLLGAHSKGRYFHVWIRGRYPFQKVT